MGSLTHTVGGDSNLVSFKSAARVPIESLKCHFAPIQDGEGDPSPENVRPIRGWNEVEVQRYGKNLINPSTNPIWNNGTYVINDDNTVTVKGSDGRGWTSMQISPFLLKKGTYTFSWTGSPRVQFATSEDDYQTVTSYSKFYFTFTLSKDGGIKWKHTGASTDYPLTITVQIEYGSIATEYEPYYGEIIPITFPNINKNLFEFTSFNYTDWSTAGYPLSPIIDVEANSVTLTGQGSGDTQLYNLKNIYYPGTYTFSFDMTYVSTVNPDKRMIIRCYNENDQLMKADEVTINNFIYNQYYRGWFGVPQTFTVPNNVKYFRLSIGCGNDKKGDTITISNIQLEYGSTATTYEPYDFYNIVYGGYIDLAKGELVAESILRHFDGTENWEPATGADGYAPRRIYLRNVEPSDGKYTCALSDKLASSGNWAPPLYAANINNHGHLVIGVSENIKTKQDAENWIQSIGGFNVVCKLTNSIHYPIKQSKLTTLLGKNNTWSNTNNITEVSYAVHDSAMIRAAKQRMAVENDKHYRKVLWNQMAGPMTSQYWKRYNSNITSVDFIDDYAEVTITQTAPTGYQASIYTSNEPLVYIDHFYYASYMIEPLYSNGQFYMELGGGATTPYMKVSADEWSRVSSSRMKGLRTGSGRLYIPNFVPNTYQVGDKVRVKNAIYIDLTKMFGYGNEPTGEEFEKLCAMNNIDLTQYHPIDSGTEQIWCIPGHNTNEYITVNWNQNAKSINSSNYKAYNSNNISVTFEDNMLISTWLQEGAEYSFSACANYSKTHTVGNYYYLTYEYYTDIDGYISGDVGGVTTPYKRTQTNQWTRYSTIVQRTTGGNLSNYVVYVGRFSNTIKPTIDNFCKIRNIVAIDLTQMFGAGNEPSTSEELRIMCLKNNINLDEAQPYNTGTKMIWKV